ncbi:MAG: primosomal protein N' [Proteobacteria bacterium]|nr:primosomal protein N' [Pseudomonadota bacterium]
MIRPDFPLAEVAVAVPAAGTFHYLVPPDLTGRIGLGHRVLVPFGPRRVTGYVLDLLDSVDPSIGEIEYKEILQPLDDEPLFMPGLIPFFRFASRYYHYPLGLVIAEALPAGLKVMSRKTVRLTPRGERILKQGPASGVETELLARLNRPAGLTMARLAREKGEALALLRRFEAKGWVRIETRLQSDRVRARTRKWLSLRWPGQAPPVRIGPKERELLDLLADQGPQPMPDLRDRFPSLGEIVRRLKAKDRIRVEEREVYRDALGRALYFDGRVPDSSPEQSAAGAVLNQALEAGRYRTFLLHGVTGSGKTEVYLAALAQALDLGRTGLVLVPEISLTPSMEGLLRARFREDLAVLHSGLSDGERYDQWLKARRRQVRIVLGARSAVWAPLEDIGLIVVDEEHDGSYKQDDKLRYQARDLAVLRGQQSGAVVVLGSATPSLESRQASLTGRYGLLTLKNRVGGGRLPRVDVVDLRFDSGRRRGALTPMMKQALKETLDQGSQALLFINRRGLAGLPVCLACGHVIKCLNCSVSLTLHQHPDGADETRRLICHYCGFDIPPPERCPACSSGRLRYLGLGTERVEQEVQKAFPEARVGRLDADTARPKGGLTRILEGLRDRTLDVVVGTQMVTKGHDFPHITLVGVIEADLGLHLPDFRAGERTFQLLSQVGGRAGRGEDAGRVVIQTLSPDHYALLKAKRHDYDGFFDLEIEQRRELGYPPFSRLILARLQGNDEDRTRQTAEIAARTGRELAESDPGSGVEILGPAPAPLSKIVGKHRFQILVRGPRVNALHDFTARWLDRVRPGLKGTGVSMFIDVDPYQMM